MTHFLPVGRKAHARFAVLGLWHLGCVNAVGLAEMGMGHPLTAWDPDPARIKSLSRGKPPVYEPGLADRLKHLLSSGRLSFYSSLKAAVRNAEVVMFAFDTPLNDRDKPNLSVIWKALRELTPVIGEQTWLVVRSQVPVGTCQEMERRLKKGNRRWKGEIICWPENLRLGSALASFWDPSPLVLGAARPETAREFSRLLHRLRVPPILMNLNSAEISKHALNILLATCITYSNELADSCKRLGGDAVRILSAVSKDPRVGSKLPLLPGLSFSGGTLARDLAILSEKSPQPNFFDEIRRANRRHALRIINQLGTLLGGVKGRRIGVLGLTYKAGTSTLRRSLAVELVRAICARGAKVKAFDPKADWDEVSLPRKLVRARSALDAAQGVDAIVFMTDWPQFKKINFSRLRKAMRRPLIFDPRNMFWGQGLDKLGFQYCGLAGKPCWEEGWTL